MYLAVIKFAELYCPNSQVWSFLQRTFSGFVDAQTFPLSKGNEPRRKRKNASFVYIPFLFKGTELRNKVLQAWMERVQMDNFVSER